MSLSKTEKLLAQLCCQNAMIISLLSSQESSLDFKTILEFDGNSQNILSKVQNILKEDDENSD